MSDPVLQDDEFDDDVPEKTLRYVRCPQCRKVFQLTWNDYSDRPQTLILHGCPSGGIYDVLVQCPHCQLREAL